jgi:septum site-determining protein MinD
MVSIYVECTLNQALIKDKRQPKLFVLAASQTKDKTILTEDGVGRVLDELRQNFDYIVCDSPAGIESGARHAMYFCGEDSMYQCKLLRALIWHNLNR